MGALPKKTGKLYRLHQTLWVSGTTDVMTAAEATALGEDYEIVVGHYQQYGGTPTARSTAVDNAHAAALAAADPHEIKACVYVNGTYGSAGDFPDSLQHLVPEFMYSGDPTLPYLVDGGNTWLMDPRDRGWNYKCRGVNTSVPEQMDDRRATKFGATNADGGLVDSLGWGIVTTTYNHKVSGDSNPPGTVGANTAPVNSQTGNQWQSATDKGIWVRHTGALAGACEQYHPADAFGSDWATGREGAVPISVYCNGVSRGTRWWDIDGPTWLLAKYARLCMAENWIRDATEAADFSALQTLAEWKADVNYVIDCQNMGRGALLWTKVWDTHTHDDDKTVSTWAPSTDIFTSTAHGLVAGDKIGFFGSTSAPANLSLSTMYFARTITTNTFKVATTNSDATIVDIVGSPVVGQAYKVRKVVSENSTDDGNDTDITKWHRLAAGSFMLATNGRSFAQFTHDYPSGNQRIPRDRWKDKIDLMGWYTEAFTTGLGVWCDIDATTITNNEFNAVGHGFTTNQQVVVDAEQLIPGNIPRRTALFVRPATVGATANFFKLSLTSGGAAIDLTNPNGDPLPYRVRVRSKDGANGASCGIAAAQDPTATNLYVRHFEDGIVIVNPTGAATLNTYTLPVGTTWTDVDDVVYANSITVSGANYAALLRRGGVPVVFVPYSAVTIRLSSASTVSTHNSNPTMKAVTTMLFWREVNPSPGVFDFSQLNTSITDAHTDGYKIPVRLMMGCDAPIGHPEHPGDPNYPNWMRTHATLPVECVRGFANEQSRVGEEIFTPVPWDPNLLHWHRELLVGFAAWLNTPCPSGGGHNRSEHVWWMALAICTELGSEMSFHYRVPAHFVNYSSAAVNTLTNQLLVGNTTSFTITGSLTGWPSGNVLVRVNHGGYEWDVAAGQPSHELIWANRAGSTLTIQASGRGFSGTTAQTHAAGTAVVYALDDGEATGTYAVPEVLNGVSGVYDQDVLGHSIWENATGLGGLDSTETNRRLWMKQQWIASIADYNEVMPTSVPACLAGGSMFDDGFAGADSIALTVAPSYTGQLYAMVTDLHVSTAGAKPWHYPNASAIDYLNKAESNGWLIGLQTGATSLAGAGNGDEVIQACEDALDKWGATSLRFIETQNRMSAGPFTTTARNEWTGGNIATMREYFLTRANENLQVRILDGS